MNAYAFDQKMQKAILVKNVSEDFSLGEETMV